MQGQGGDFAVPRQGSNTSDGDLQRLGPGNASALFTPGEDFQPSAVQEYRSQGSDDDDNTSPMQVGLDVLVQETENFPDD